MINKANILFIIILIFSNRILFAQVTAPDCNVAVNICSNANFAIDPNGPGAVNDFTSFSHGVSNPLTNPASTNSGCLFSGELNPTWMIINVATSGNLEFNFGAGTQSGCYDWIMWPYNANTCSGIFNNTLPPVRCNWNGNCADCGTGIGPVPPNATGFNCQSNYEPTLPVTAGQQFIICFSNYSGVYTNVPLSFTGTAQVSCNPVNVIGGTICPGQCINLLATGGLSGHTWTPATGLNTTTGTSVQACPTTTTTYTVTANILPSGTASDTAIVTVLPANDPQCSSTCSVTASSNSPICEGQTLNLTSTNLTGYTYSWTGPNGFTSTNQNPTISNATAAASGTYTVVATSGTVQCSSSVNVIVNPKPVVSVTPASASICQGNNVSLTASGADGYIWSPATGLSGTTIANPVANPTTTTTYTVIGANLTGCSDTTNVTVTVNPLPVITFTPANPSICVGQSVNITANGANSYNWSPSSGLNNTTSAAVVANPLNSTNYTVVGTSAAGCTNTANVTVTVNAVPTITITPSNPTICSGASTNLVASGASNYVWSPATGLNTTTSASVTASPSNTTVYQVIGSTAQGCADTASVTLTVNPSPVVTVTPNNPTICLGNSTVLNFGGAITYTVSPLTGLSGFTGTSVNASPQTTTTYTITGTDANGCVNTATATVTILNLPNIAINPPNPQICINGNIDITAVGADTYTWSPAIGLSSTTGATVNASPLNSTTYTITGTDLFGCVNTFTFNLNVNPLPIIQVNPSVAYTCPGDFVSLVAGGAVNYVWSPATGLNQTLGPQVLSNPPSPITYTVVGTDANGCVDSTTVSVDFYDVPTASFTVDKTESCPPLEVNLTSTSSTNFACNWTLGDGNFSTDCNLSYSYSAPGEYSVFLMVTDSNGCRHTSPPQLLTVYALPEAQFNITPQTTTIVSPTVFLDGLFSSENTTSWSWLINNSDSLIGAQVNYTFQDTGLFPITLYVTNSLGCMDSVTYYAKVLDDFTFFIPNAFTVNNDGLNETFGPKGIGISPSTEDYEFMIFNRWGEKIFETNDFNQHWDGKKNGALCEAGVYTYKIRLVNIYRQPKVYYGHFTLIR
ncbi:MAG: gliding motility-associated C-terminal domain-containing protein [Bacteroidia bacterium]